MGLGVGPGVGPRTLCFRRRIGEERTARCSVEAARRSTRGPWADRDDNGDLGTGDIYEQGCTSGSSTDFAVPVDLEMGAITGIGGDNVSSFRATTVAATGTAESRSSATAARPDPVQSGENVRRHHLDATRKL
ncbi:hypothetical protein GCM10023216_14660 [Isoptericola chiayiensis]|uniref:Uncharacterized protein n=1 Tax=Isoptericola chiayiensis TaxID=579446 RepID=A0ABP8YAJ1_9MICO